MTQPAVEFRAVSKAYGEQAVLEQFNLTIPKGKVQTIIGPSGCGKTTLLKMVNRLIEPDSGKILVEGRDIGEADAVELRRSIGYVIQQIGLFPHLTIEENIALVPRLKGVKKKQLIGRTEELLDLIGLDPSSFRHRYPSELSGGQQQRIGVARALASDPSIVLMDEPFSALDPISRVQLQRELAKLNAQLHKTIIFVTHDIDEALKIGDQILLLQSGRIVQNATAEEILQAPANDFVREFVGPERYAAAARQPEETVDKGHEVQAKDLVTESVSIYTDTTAQEAVLLIRQHGAEGLFVTDNELRIVGVVGLPELSLHFGSNERVEQLMRRNVPFVTEHTLISELVPLLQQYSAIPVVDLNQRLLGSVTRTSVLRAAAKGLRKERVTV